MSVKPLRTDLSCPSTPRKSMSASISTLRASMGTLNSAALAAIPEVRQPARAASTDSAAVGAASTPPRPAGASIVTKKRRVGGVAAFPRISCAPISTRALTPRCQVERSLTVRFPRAGFSRTFRSSSFMPSTSTSFSPSAMGVLLGIVGGLWAFEVELQGRVHPVAEIGRGHRQGQLDQLPVREMPGQRGVERVVDLAVDGELLGVADDEPLQLPVGGARRGIGEAVELRRGEADLPPEGRVEGVADGGPVEPGGRHERELPQAGTEGQRGHGPGHLEERPERGRGVGQHLAGQARRGRELLDHVVEGADLLRRLVPLERGGPPHRRLRVRWDSTWPSRSGWRARIVTVSSQSSPAMSRAARSVPSSGTSAEWTGLPRYSSIAAPRASGLVRS